MHHFPTSRPSLGGIRRFAGLVVAGCFLCAGLAGCEGPTGVGPDSAADSLEAAPMQPAFDEAPSWAADVVWYQIFVERFRNGDPANDPTPEDMVGSYPGFIPDSWQLTPWTADWYKPDSYFADMEGKPDDSGNPVRSFGQKAQLRRYGGDLQGVLDEIDYLDTLGVTAIFFNPLNDAASLHKYDARNWRHIDRNFGPTPREDAQTIAAETPIDPSTWKWTGADRLFLKVIQELHARGMKVILDFSWNHTGQPFWAFQDVLAKGEASAYADWYRIDRFDDPSTDDNEFSFSGWAGVKGLPELRETAEHPPGPIRAYEGDLASVAAKEHIFNVTRRWLDPNADGDPSDGVDGFRLDVAAEIGLGFWRDYRKVVRAVNPDAYLVGEVWWEVWPETLMNPAPFVQGDVFDAVMNYRWYRSTRHFFNESPDVMPVTEFVDSLRSFARGIDRTHRYAMMNLTASHDTPRVSTSLYNHNRYKYHDSPDADPDYRVNRPDAKTWETLDLLLAQQFTFVGAPHIWAGDEMGMWGANDPSTRKPLIWPDYSFEPEAAHPNGKNRPVDAVVFDTTLFARYRKLISIRNTYPVLARGDIEYVLVNDETRTLAFRRHDATSEVFAVFNADTVSHPIKLDARGTAFTDVLSGHPVAVLDDGVISVVLGARRAAILIAQ